MEITILPKLDILTQEEKELFEFHSSEIQTGIKKGIEARNEVISHVLAVIESEPPLWREHYSSEEEYVKTELNIEMSSFWRSVKDNKNYLYLFANTEDPDEQITLSRMRGAAYRELRQLATDNKPLLKKGGEKDEDYREKLVIKEKEDLILVQQLWSEIYPRIVKFKKESNTGIYPNGGYSITAKDITETCVVIHQIANIPRLLAEGVPPSAIPVSSIEGEDISLQEVMDASGDETINVIEILKDRGVDEALVEKLKRQNSYIEDSLKKKYVYDQYVGKLIYEDGRLKIENQYMKYDLINEWSDLLEKETSISVRRVNREL